MSAVVVGEHALAIIRRGDLTNDEAVALFSGIIALNYGWSSFTAARELDTPGGTAEQMGSLRRRRALRLPR